MPDIDNGLPNKVSEEWGYPYLWTSYTERTFCDCEFCRGCGPCKVIELPEEEWEWKPRRPIVDMSDAFLRLNNTNSKLLKMFGALGKDTT